MEDGPKQGWPKEFVIGLFGSDDADEVLTRHEPMRALLERELDHPVRIFAGTSYSVAIEAMRANRSDAMAVGAYSYSHAAREAGAEAIAAMVTSTDEHPVYDPEAKPYYYSMILVKKGSGIRTLDDLRGKQFLFVDPVSTSGHLFPKTLLMDYGIDPETEMRTAFSNSHPVSVLQVYNERADACASYEYYLVRAHREGVIQYSGFADGKTLVPRTQAELDEAYERAPEGHLVAIAQSEAIPRTPFAVKASLPDSFKSAVRSALLKLKDDPESVAKTRFWFVDPTEELGLNHLDEFYDPIREKAKLLGLDLDLADR